MNQTGRLKACRTVRFRRSGEAGDSPASLLDSPQEYRSDVVGRAGGTGGFDETPALCVQYFLISAGD